MSLTIQYRLSVTSFATNGQTDILICRDAPLSITMKGASEKNKNTERTIYAKTQIICGPAISTSYLFICPVQKRWAVIKFEVHFLYFCTFCAFYGLTFFFHFLAFLYVCMFVHLYFYIFVLLYFYTVCTFVLSPLVGRCIWTSMQSLESVALKMTELWVLLYLCTFFVLFVLLYFIWTIHTNFFVKFGVCRSKNGWVIALGTKEDILGHGGWGGRGGGAHFLQLIIQSQLVCSKFASLDNWEEFKRLLLNDFLNNLSAVSYTHLTLPTILLV